jgi:hypothetical protein
MRRDQPENPNQMYVAQKDDVFQSTNQLSGNHVMRQSQILNEMKGATKFHEML